MVNPPTRRPLYVFIDESGNFDFSPKGTKYWVLAAVATQSPMSQREKLMGMRYQLLAEGHDHECFHATEDRQTVRDDAYGIIGQLDDISVHAVYVQKNKAHPSLYEKPSKGRTKHKGEDVYSVAARSLLKYVFMRYGERSDLSEVVVVLGSLFNKTKQGSIKRTLKRELKAHLKKPFHLYFHDGKSDINSQIADYCSWAVYRSVEDEELRPFRAVQSRVKTTFDLFARGTAEYYRYPEK